MAQNIYDDPIFFAGYSKLRRSVHGLAGAPEWPAMQAMLPALQGLKIADLGCGYGWFCQWAGAQGAAQVQGFDLSEKMLERAAAATSDRAIEYRRADLETLELPAAAFDLVYSSLTLHYIRDLPRLFACIYRALLPGGRFVFSIEHPIFMASPAADWLADAQGNKVWPVSRYQLEGPRLTNWLAEGVVKQHRTMGTLFSQLIAAGLVITHVNEWGPTTAQIEQQPALAEEAERPMLLLVGVAR